MAGEGSSLSESVRRLERALGALDDAIDRRLENVRHDNDVDAELHRLGTDRSRLAVALDTAEAKAAKLEGTNREVARRLIGAMETIRGVLARNGG